MHLDRKPKIIVIVGPTASGKTSLSITLAKQFNGEIVSADSRQVYKGLDLGSGKVTEREKDEVPHHLLDIVEPNTVYTASDYKRDTRKVMAEICARDNVPIVVGGTFFYVDVLLGKMSVPTVPPNPSLRAVLETQTEEELYVRLQEKDAPRAQTIDSKNKRRLIRALEIVDALGTVPKTEQEEPYEVLTLGIEIPKETLHKNIHQRIIERIDQGMIEEVEALHKNGISFERLESFGLEYRYISQFLQNKVTKNAMLTKLELETQHFAKRQMTWLKRDKSIVWVDKNNITAIKEIVDSFLNN